MTVQPWCQTQTMVCAVLLVCIRVLHTTARGPNPICETIFPGRKTHSADNEKIMYLQKMCSFRRM